MNRIIINEQDLTSNVEALSSYDVVYVPGFGASATAFRDPTLFTSKYDFLAAYGGNAREFPENQYYVSGDWNPNAIPGVTTTDAFPDAFEGMGDITWDFTGTDDALVSITFEASEGVGDYYNNANKEAFIEAYCVQVAAKREMTAGDQWLVCDKDTDVITVDTYTEGKHPDGTQFECNPSFQGFYLPDGTGYKPVGSDILTKADQEAGYHVMIPGQVVMFPAGSLDTGYRYALLLLSMGIPVYYEQMNTADMEEVKCEAGNKEELEQYVLEKRLWEKNPMWQHGCTDFSQYVLATAVVDGNTYYVGAPIQIDALYEGLMQRFAVIDDSGESESPATGREIDNMGDYTIKFFTTGGYPTYEYKESGLAETMLEACTKRADAIALIDHTNHPDRPITASNKKSVAYSVRNWTLTGVAGSYGAMFTPWYECTSPLIADSSTVSGEENYAAMPASLAYLTALARQIRDYNPWLAVAGVSRGVVPYFGKLHINKYLSNNIADSYQLLPQDGYKNPDGALRCINPITNIRNYGHCIWGNRTLRSNSEGTKATSFLSTRNQISDIKKCIYETSQKLLFEQNSDVLWVNWRSFITPLLDAMVSNNIISDYGITRYRVDPETGDPVPAYKVLASIRVVPINAIEQFEITVNIENDTADVLAVEIDER